MKRNIFLILFLLIFSIQITATGVIYFSSCATAAASATSVSQNENVQPGSTTTTTAATTPAASATSVSQNENVQPVSTTNTTANPTTTASGGGTIFPNPLGSVTTVSALLSSILTNLMGIMAIISLIFIILGGIMYMLSAGNETMVTRAKKTWTGAVIGLAIAMAAPTFLKTIQAILGGNSNPNGNADAWVSEALTLKDIAINVLNLLLSLVGVIAMIAMVIGGLMYLTAAGEEKRVDQGKAIFKNSIIGIIVALSALVVIRQVSALLGA